MWSEGEVVRLFKRAWRDGYHGLAAVIAVAWSTQLSPGDVRALRASSSLPRRWGGILHYARQDRLPVGGALSDRALAAVEAYIAVLGVELHGEAYIFRNRSGAPYSSDTLGDDFRDIRHAVFGAGESRTLADFRRSGAQEAFAGGAKPADVVARHGEHPRDLEHAVCHLQSRQPRDPGVQSGRERPAARGRPKLSVQAGSGTQSVQKSEHDGPKSRNGVANPAKSLKSGGSDGTRTRDLRRDRPTL